MISAKLQDRRWGFVVLILEFLSWFEVYLLHRVMQWIFIERSSMEIRVSLLVHDRRCLEWRYPDSLFSKVGISGIASDSITSEPFRRHERSQISASEYESISLRIPTLTLQVLSVITPNKCLTLRPYYYTPHLRYTARRVSCFFQHSHLDVTPSEKIKDRWHHRLNARGRRAPSIARSIILTIFLLLIIATPLILSLTTLRSISIHTSISHKQEWR